MSIFKKAPEKREKKIQPSETKYWIVPGLGDYPNRAEFHPAALDVFESIGCHGSAPLWEK